MVKSNEQFSSWFEAEILYSLKDQRICSCLKAVEEIEDCPISLKYQLGGNGI